jgi:hypothetical protein
VMTLASTPKSVPPSVQEAMVRPDAASGPKVHAQLSIWPATHAGYYPPPPPASSAVSTAPL